MSKGGRRLQQKSKSQKGVAGKRPALAPIKASSAPRLEMGAVVVVSTMLLLMVWLHWLTDASQRTLRIQWLHSVLHTTKQLRLPTWLFSSAAWDSWCENIHRVTSACFFLSGAVHTNASVDGWQYVRTLWTDASASTKYQRDPFDALFAIVWGMILFVIRFACMQCLLLPLGRMLVSRPSGNQAQFERKLHRRIGRFAEQGWVLILYVTSLILVVLAMKRQPFWVWKPEYLWLGYPVTTTDALTKAVYLWEASNYIHQVFVINLEERRSDFWQMLTHHIVTLLLIGGSYVSCFHYVGLVILVLMDPADICLSIAKLSKYMGSTTVCDVLFAIFMLVWIITRHIGYAFVWWSCFKDAPRLIPFGTSYNLASGHMLTQTSYVLFLALLGMLQMILLVWLGMILRIALRVVTAKGAVDTRSDDESD